jgi:hypothetical protein
MSEPNDNTPAEENEPNESGFAGDPTGPTPEPERGPGEGFGEAIAVPAGDITGALMEAITESTQHEPVDQH